MGDYTGTAGVPEGLERVFSELLANIAIYVCTYVYIYVYTYVCMCIYICICICICIYIYTLYTYIQSPGLPLQKRTTVLQACLRATICMAELS